MDSGTDDVQKDEPQNGSARPYDRDLISLTSQAPSPGATSAGPETAAMHDSLRDVSERMSQSEKRAADLARKLEASINQIAERLETVRQPAADAADAEASLLDPIERKLAQLTEKLEAAERQRLAAAAAGKKPDDKAVAALERTVSAVVDHLEASEKRHEESLAEIRASLGQMQSRFVEAEEANAREEAEARARHLETNLDTLATRLERMEQSFTGIGSTLEKTQSQAVEAALKAIAERADADGQKNTINHLQQSLSAMAQRLEKAESRADQSLGQFEKTVETISKKLESLDKPRPEVVPAVVKAVEQRLDQMSKRLETNEKLSIEAAQMLEKAMSSINQSLQTTDIHSRETVETLQQMLQRMSDRMARVEKQAKARASQPMLSPQIGIGAGHNGGPGMGFMPGGTGFPAPNFDSAPVMGGNGFGDQSMRQNFRAPEAVAPAAAPVPEPRLAPAPPPVAPPMAREQAAPPPPFAEPDDIDDEEDDVSPEESVTDAQVQGAHDFLAAARRAAQMAAQNGQNGAGPYFGPGGQPPYVDADSRFGAFKAETSEGPSKLLIAAASLMLVAALAIGGYFAYSSNERAETPLTPEMTAPEVTAKTPDTVYPEATPEDADAEDQASASPMVEPEAGPADEKTDVPTPVSKPAAPKPETSAPTAKDAGTATLTPGPKLTPQPSKPVETAPLPAANDLASKAASGDPAAEYQLGLDYANGDGVGADMTKAAEWYRKSADQGMAVAQYRLAALYEKGRGVSQSNSKAMEWYAKAAAGGNVKAMHNLAVIYAEGRGAKQDFATAAKWFEQAAQYGLGDSQYNLAILNERGLGVTANPVEAYKWFSIAAKGGDSGAAKKRDDLATRMEPSALAKAKVAAETFRPRQESAVANGDISSLKSWK
ncbi:MAG: hypothetical protein GC184_09460 [Rhizobiales bacterium]|nr:hypothetical protein [Hyphomicrobiales bacterium]